MQALIGFVFIAASRGEPDYDIDVLSSGLRKDLIARSYNACLRFLSAKEVIVANRYCTFGHSAIPKDGIVAQSVDANSCGSF